MKHVDARTCSVVDRFKYVALLNGRVPMHVMAADEENGWVDVCIPCDKRFHMGHVVMDTEGVMITRLRGDVKIVEAASLSKTESSSDDIPE